jgi:hypothetical protein
MWEQVVTAQAIFGSKSKTVVLEEVAKAVQPVSAHAIARVSGLDPKNVYEECAKLNSIGIFRSITTGKNQTSYLYSNSKEAEKLRQFVQSLIIRKKERAGGPSVIEKISASLPMTDYYVSLPVALRITFDVFYYPAYVMIFVDQRDKAMIPELLKSLQSANVGQLQQKSIGVIIKAVSLWGREFKYDEVTDAPLASNEQSIADGLNYYGEIRDREIIRTLLTRTSDFDLRKVVEKLSEKGKTRLYAIIAIKNKIRGKLDNQEEQEALASFQNRRGEKAFRLDNGFKSDLSLEAIPMLFPNDEAYGGGKQSRTLSKATATVSEVLKSFA